MKHKFILKAKAGLFVSREDLEDLRTTFMRELSEGVAIVPEWAEVTVITEDVFPLKGVE